MEQYLQAVATLFSLVNPMICAMMFSTASQGQGRAAKMREATGAMLILFAASPGTITGVMTIVAAHKRRDIPVTALVAIAAVLGLTWLLLLDTAFLGGRKTSGPGLARDMVGRYMGLIVTAMGIQFALSGYKAFRAT